ncbi:CinA family protein [Helicobacter sp. T3_23-1059]
MQDSTHFNTSKNDKDSTHNSNIYQKNLGKIYFLNMDIASAMTLCGDMLNKNNLIAKYDSEICASIFGDERDFGKFVAWCKGFFGANVVFGDSLESIAIARLQSKGLLCATAESCTGGLLAYHFTRNAGASQVFLGGVVSYDNAIKQRFLDVKESSLEDFGAVSEQVVSQMLCGALERFGAQVALASSGIAGPSGGNAQKPVGTVFLGAQKMGEKPLIEQHFFVGTRIQIQEQSCQKALEMLLKII